MKLLYLMDPQLKTNIVFFAAVQIGLSIPVLNCLFQFHMMKTVVYQLITSQHVIVLYLLKRVCTFS